MTISIESYLSGSGPSDSRLTGQLRSLYDIFSVSAKNLSILSSKTIEFMLIISIERLMYSSDFVSGIMMSVEMVRVYDCI